MNAWVVSMSSFLGRNPNTLKLTCSLVDLGYELAGSMPNLAEIPLSAEASDVPWKSARGV
jgi:hypothetical protein